ncbi:MAG: hypothetical protein LC650_02390 [Actinobacteria bacterium]|nr:hypothetical protein [Actinomycetota bacterium]
MTVQSIREFMTKNYMPPQGFTPYKGRSIAYGQRVKVYKNLHKNTYSVVDVTTGLVLGYADRITLQDVDFKVSEAGRQRVLQEKRKNVHAYVTGTFVATTGATQRHTAYYNPYKVETFVTSTQEALHEAAIATLEPSGVTYTGRL